MVEGVSIFIFAQEGSYVDRLGVRCSAEIIIFSCYIASRWVAAQKRATPFQGWPLF